MNREEYFKLPALNFSMAKHLLRGPAWFKAAQDEEREETDAMRIGTLVHSMVLEDKDLRDLYAIKPEGMSFATKDGKEWRAAQKLPIITEDDANGIPRIAEAIAANRDAAAMLRGCPIREHAIVGEMRGVACKALLDMHGAAGGLFAIADLKTALDASPREFAKAAARQHYDMQAAWYSSMLALEHGLESPPFFGWIVVEKKAPYFSAVYQPDDEMLENGHRKMELALERYKAATASDDWSLPSGGIQALSLPAWAAFGEEVAA